MKTFQKYNQLTDLEIEQAVAGKDAKALGRDLQRIVQEVTAYLRLQNLNETQEETKAQNHEALSGGNAAPKARGRARSTTSDVE